MPKWSRLWPVKPAQGSSRLLSHPSLCSLMVKHLVEAQRMQVRFLLETLVLFLVICYIKQYF